MAAPAIDFDPQMTREDRLTLLDLVAAVQDAAQDDAEATATLRHMVETHHVRFEALGFDDLPRVA